MAESDKTSAQAEIRDKRSCRAVKHFFWPCSLSSSEDSSQGYSEKEHCSAESTLWLRNNCNPEQHQRTGAEAAYHKQPANQFTLGETASLKVLHTGLDTFKQIRIKVMITSYQRPVSLHIKLSDFCISLSHSYTVNIILHCDAFWVIKDDLNLQSSVSTHILSKPTYKRE